MTEATHSFSSRFSRARARARDLPHDAQLLRGHVRLAPRQLEVHVHAAVWHRRGTDGEGRRSEARRQAEGSARQRWRVRRVRRVRGVRRVRAAGRRRGPRVAASRTFRPARPGSRSPASRPSPPARRRWDARGAEGSMAPSGRDVSEPAPSRRVGSPQSAAPRCAAFRPARTFVRSMKCLPRSVSRSEDIPSSFASSSVVSATVSSSSWMASSARCSCALWAASDSAIDTGGPVSPRGARIRRKDARRPASGGGGGGAGGRKGRGTRGTLVHA